MREFNSKDSDALDFERVCSELLAGKDGISLEKVVHIPEADILRCKYKGKDFNVKFDLDYGVSLEAVSDFSVSELEGVARILTA